MVEFKLQNYIKTEVIYVYGCIQIGTNNIIKDKRSESSELLLSCDLHVVADVVNVEIRKRLSIFGHESK